MDENVKEYWLSKYKEDKIGTIAKLSQAMQHMAWLREWQRMNGNKPRIKPITEKVNGEKIQIGEADIAVPWSELDGFFRAGNEYGDIETVKFLLERIERGDVSELTNKETLDLSEKENVKWSDGKHSLNPLQGYLYEFSYPRSYFLEIDSIGNCGNFSELGFYQDLIYHKKMTERELIKEGFTGEELEVALEQECRAYKESVINDEKSFDRENLHVREGSSVAFARYYTTRFLQKLLKDDPRYSEFTEYDITSVKTPEQIEELDTKIMQLLESPEIQEKIESIEDRERFERELYDELETEVAVEVKKDSDRIENAHKIFVALETGNLDEIMEDEETARWAKEVYERERAESEAAKKAAEAFVEDIGLKEAVDATIANREQGHEYSANLHAVKEVVAAEEGRTAEEKPSEPVEEFIKAETTQGIADLPRQIATADKDAKIMGSDLMPLEKKGFKEWIKGLINKLKGRDEK